MRWVVAGCLLATAGAAPAQSASDPFESWNRAVFRFNEGLDAALLEPLATGYQAVVPEVVRSGVSNFYANFGDGWSAINQLLQGKPVAAAQMVMRMATNSLFGIGGLFDVASDLGIERQQEDFGQTLGRWGAPPGPYLVTPLLGPSSLRDTLALPLDKGWRASLLVQDDPTSIGLTTLQLIDARAGLLGAGRLVDELALDKYVFIRDGYLARRRSLVYDGDPPELPELPELPEPAEPPPAVPK